MILLKISILIQVIGGIIIELGLLSYQNHNVSHLFFQLWLILFTCGLVILVFYFVQKDEEKQKAKLQ